MTLLLALEVSEKTGSVALYDKTQLLTGADLSPDQRSARSLIPGIKALFDFVGRRPSETGAVAVSIGPGSFTGLRIGVTTAKVFAYAASARILGVDTLSALAAGVDCEKTSVRTVSAAMDAQRGEVVAQTFKLVSGGLADEESRLPQPVGQASLIPVAEWVDRARMEDAALISPILQRYRDSLPPGTEVLDAKYWYPKAYAVGHIALARLRTHETDDLWTLTPIYSRLAAAEERLGKSSGEQESRP